MNKNVFFFHTINSIGGVETFFWELAKKYSGKYDITVYYVNGDDAQIQRLKQYVRCIKYRNEKVKCEKAFFNYNLSPLIENLEAEHTYEIIHADFKLQRNLKPRVDPRIDTYLAVSQVAADSFRELTGIECEVCPNPLTVEKISNPPLFLCAAQRMTSEKGLNRVREIVSRLDRDREIKYYMLLFTNDPVDRIQSPNVCHMKHRLDIRPYIFGCDLFLALSDSEGRCYSVGEKLAMGTGKLLLTPCPSFFEQGADDENSIILDFDMGNIDEVIEKIRVLYREKIFRKSFNIVKPKDIWNHYLAKGDPDYEGIKYYIVRATDGYVRGGIFDTQLNMIPEPGTEFKVTGERLEKLLGYSRGPLVEVIREDGKP